MSVCSLLFIASIFVHVSVCIYAFVFLSVCLCVYLSTCVSVCVCVFVGGSQLVDNTSSSSLAPVGDQSDDDRGIEFEAPRKTHVQLRLLSGSSKTRRYISDELLSL